MVCARPSIFSHLSSHLATLFPTSRETFIQASSGKAFNHDHDHDHSYSRTTTHKMSTTRVVSPGEREAEEKAEARIILCHNCGWNATHQQRTLYVSTVKCIYACSDRGVWQLGNEWILKEQSLGCENGLGYVGPDAATVNWVHKNKIRHGRRTLKRNIRTMRHPMCSRTAI